MGDCFLWLKRFGKRFFLHRIACARLLRRSCRSNVGHSERHDHSCSPFPNCRTWMRSFLLAPFLLFLVSLTVIIEQWTAIGAERHSKVYCCDGRPWDVVLIFHPKSKVVIQMEETCSL